MTHTQGPWHVGRNTDVCVFANEQQIAYPGDGLPIREAEANAQLIAAAPELLAALEGLRTSLREHVKLDVKRHYSLMVADAAAGTAIAKATQP